MCEKLSGAHSDIRDPNANDKIKRRNKCEKKKNEAKASKNEFTRTTKTAKFTILYRQRPTTQYTERATTHDWFWPFRFEVAQWITPWSQSSSSSWSLSLSSSTCLGFFFRCVFSFRIHRLCWVQSSAAVALTPFASFDVCLYRFSGSLRSSSSSCRDDESEWF